MSEPTLEEIKDNIEGLIANYQKKAETVSQEIIEFRQEMQSIEKTASKLMDERDKLLSTISDLRLAIGQK